jgi:hypothetical protein
MLPQPKTIGIQGACADDRPPHLLCIEEIAGEPAYYLDAWNLVSVNGRSDPENRTVHRTVQDRQWDKHLRCIRQGFALQLTVFQLSRLGFDVTNLYHSHDSSLLWIIRGYGPH